MVPNNLYIILNYDRDICFVTSDLKTLKKEIHLDKYYVAEHHKYYKKSGWEYIRTYLCKDLVNNE